MYRMYTTVRQNIPEKAESNQTLRHMSLSKRQIQVRPTSIPESLLFFTAYRLDQYLSTLIMFPTSTESV